jgi:hypothetical protein
VSLILFGQNLLEATTSLVTVSPVANAAKPITRIFDRDRGPQYEGGSIAQTDIDIDLGSAQTVSAWSLINHNATGVTVTLYADTTSPPTTVRDSFSATGVDTLRTFASLSFRYWRIRIPALTPVPKIGEVLLGVPRTITQNPFLRTSPTVTLANVARDLSPGGFSWAVHKGAKRIRLPFGWTAMPAADITTLTALYDEVDQGAKNLLVQDPLGTLRWMFVKTPALTPVPVGKGDVEVELELEEAL